MGAAFGTKVYRTKNVAGGVEAHTAGDIFYECSYARQASTGDESVATCVDQADPERTCTPWKDRVRAVRAFYVLTICIALVSLPVAAVDSWHRLPSCASLGSKALLLGLTVSLALTSLLAWALCIRLPRTSFAIGQPSPRIRTTPGVRRRFSCSSSRSWRSGKVSSPWSSLQSRSRDE